MRSMQKLNVFLISFYMFFSHAAEPVDLKKTDAGFDLLIANLSRVFEITDQGASRVCLNIVFLNWLEKAYGQKNPADLVEKIDSELSIYDQFRPTLSEHVRAELIQRKLISSEKNTELENIRDLDLRFSNCRKKDFISSVKKRLTKGKSKHD